jgi:acyl-CoA hydrolase
MTTTHEDVGDCVDEILERLGTEIVVGAPLGIGKPNHILNELVERAVENPGIDLEIWSALALSTPEGDSDLERRLVDPIADRLFGGYPTLEYERLLQAGELPDNIEVHKFYCQPGKHLHNPTAQQQYASVNYTHVLQAIEQAEANLFLTLVGTGEMNGERYYNFGSNVDLPQDFLRTVVDNPERERDIMVVGQVSRRVPFMYGDAPVAPERFDAVLDNERYDYDLFGPPHEPVGPVEHAIGLRVSTLVRDGGTLQIGIGSLGDAIGNALELRHTRNDAYREAVDALGVREDLAADIGGLAPFEAGLYAATEMFVESFLHLFESGVLSREVYDDTRIQRLVNAGHAGDGIDADTLDGLLAEEIVSPRLDGEDVTFLRDWGVLDSAVAYIEHDGGAVADEATTGGRLRVDGETVPADLSDPATRDLLEAEGLGESLTGGQVLHAGFFIGSRSFYDTLLEMDEQRRRQFSMQSVLFTNALYGQERLKRLQRSHARFVNTAMKATATGAVVSDGLADGRVLSGVGGQFNFVNQANELDGGRSIIMLPATRGSGGSVESNIVWNYGHTTIPRHLRDIVVTEYGIADLRGKSDAEVIAEMVGIADARFQDDLVKKAQQAGKLPADWTVPERYRNNTPAVLESQLNGFRERGVLERYPYGSELTAEEQALGRSLREFQSLVAGRDLRALLDGGALRKTLRVPDAAVSYLERMDLAEPETLRERTLKRVVVLALAKGGVI